MTTMNKLWNCICPSKPTIPITDIIHCMVCTAPLTACAPQVLPCQHGFCRECLHMSLPYPIDVTCPTCGKPSPVPLRGFPAEFSHDSDCHKFLQRVMLSDTYAQDTNGRVHSSLNCRKHSTNVVTSVCVSCSVPFCDKCPCEQHHFDSCHDDRRDSMHCQLQDSYTPHRIEKVDDLVEEYSESLHQSRIEIGRCIVGKKAQLKQLDTLWSARMRRLQQAKCDLQRHVACLINELKRMEYELSQKLQQHHEEAERVQKSARDVTVRSLQNLEDIDRFVQYLTENHRSDAYHILDVLLNHDNVKSRIKTLLQGDVTVDDGIIDRLRQIHVIEMLDSFNVAQLKLDEMPADLHLAIPSPALIPPSEIPQVLALTPTLTDMIDTSRMRLVDPCQLKMTLPITQNGHAFAEALTYLPDGRLAVAMQQVCIYNRDGTLGRTHDVKSRGICAAGVRGHIMAIDQPGCKLFVFCESGDNQCFNLPPCVQAIGTLHALNVDQFLLVDKLRKIVCKCSLPAQGNMVQVDWCTKGHLTEPCGVTVDQHGRIFVSDTAKNNIQVFDANANGDYLREFGCDANIPCGQLKQPLGVCVDCYGNVLVADSGNHRVCMFDCDGLYIKDVVEKNKAGWPNMLALSVDGVLAMTDKAHQTIKLFQVYECLDSNR